VSTDSPMLNAKQKQTFLKHLRFLVL